MGRTFKGNQPLALEDAEERGRIEKWKVFDFARLLIRAIKRYAAFVGLGVYGILMVDSARRGV